MVHYLQNKYNGASERRTYRAVGMSLTTFRYASHSQDDQELEARIKQLADDNPRYGCPRIHRTFRKEGRHINHKKTARIYYKVLGLAHRRRIKKKLRSCQARGNSGDSHNR